MTTLFPPLISLIGSSSPPQEDVRFEGVGLTLGGQQILRGINLSMRRRETIAIVGESGCGKTTLLKLLIGLLTPTQGRVVFRGKSIASMDPREQSFLRRHFGFLFQAAALFDSMSVADNIAFGLRAQGILPERDIRPIILKMLTDVGLAPGVADKFPSELSGGMRKRVGLARALALNPEFMLFDEPTTGLDPIMTDMINDLILKVRSDLGITAILVTHEMRTVRKVADRVIMLGALAHLDPGEGQILFDGPVDAFMAHPDPRVQDFIQGNAQGGGGKGSSPEPDSTLRWIDPQTLAPLADETRPPDGAQRVISAPVEVDVEARAWDVAPEAIRSIPGRMSVMLGSRARRLPWEEGEEFLKPAPPPPPEPRILTDREIQSTYLEVTAPPMARVPGRTLVTLGSRAQRLPWEMGEEFLKAEPEPAPVLALEPRAPAEIDVEAKTLDVAPECMDSAPGQISLVLATEPKHVGWELGEEFLKAVPDTVLESVAEKISEDEPGQDAGGEPESSVSYLHSAFENKIFHQDETPNPTADFDGDAEEELEEESEDDAEEELEEESEDDAEEELEDESEDDEEFAEDGELDLNDPAEEEGEDFGDPPTTLGEPPTDSMVLEEPLSSADPIDPFEPYAEPEPESETGPVGETGQTEAQTRDGGADMDPPYSEPSDTETTPPASPGESKP